MDFSLILFWAVVLSGGIGFGGRIWAKYRPAASATAPPALVEYARALFPVLLIVFLLRSFVVEPFRIPSGSMLPSLYVGDFILVNKYHYGVRLPLIHKKIIANNTPVHGDIMVFRYPRDPGINFVKRVIGVPGDTIRYHRKKLYINGTKVEVRDDGLFYLPDPQPALGKFVKRYRELGSHGSYTTIVEHPSGGRDMEVTIPSGNYFVMGDNRDRSNDSRAWRFVPEANIVGRAFFVWFSWDSIGGGVRWSRIGSNAK